MILIDIFLHLDYGAFVQIPGFHKHGLVHKSQASRHFTEKISDVVEVGDSVWVRIKRQKNSPLLGISSLVVTF